MEKNSLDTIQDLQLEDIKKKSIRAVFSLTGRRIILRIIGQISFIILVRIINPSDLGLFTIVSFVVNFFGFFSDVGLAGALIQKKEVTKKDLQTTFTIQQVLVGSLVLIIIILAPFIVNTFYKSTLGSSDVILIQALAVSLLLASLKSVPSVILERKLEFNKLVIPEIVETLIYNAVLIGMVLQGYRVWSFVSAVLIRGVVGVVIMYSLVRFPVGFLFDKKSLKALMKFGLPYQLNGLIALIKDNIVPTFIGATLGT
ncbi:MAG: oligosaccharide flippase family protein, partial [bacterium]|nr:oligosaccharide flippase family protein [bacterium]